MATLGGGHTMQYTHDILWKCALETDTILITNVTLIVLLTKLLRLNNEAWSHTVFLLNEGPGGPAIRPDCLIGKYLSCQGSSRRHCINKQNNDSNQQEALEQNKWWPGRHGRR